MSTRPEPRELTVIGAHHLSPSMQRVSLGGPGLAAFPAGQQGGYIKLLLGEDASGKRIIRTYTIREQHEDRLVVDFAVHGGEAAGPATRWALSALAGSTIMVGGPGAAKPLPQGHDFYFVAGDMTALPAIGVNLAALDREARGFAAIEVQSEKDIQQLDAPCGFEVRWIVNDKPGTQPGLLADTLRGVPLPQGTIAGWAACEFSSMQRLRAYLRDELQLRGPSLYISSYWKAGLVEDDHKIAKRADAEAQPA